MVPPAGLMSGLSLLMGSLVRLWADLPGQEPAG